MSMCKKCEISGISMPLVPLSDEEIKQVTLPNPWGNLIENGFHPDLVLRAKAHLAWSIRHAKDDAIAVGNARAYLASLAKGFQNPFQKETFFPKEGENFFELKKMEFWR